MRRIFQPRRPLRRRRVVAIGLALIGSVMLAATFTTVVLDRHPPVRAVSGDTLSVGGRSLHVIGIEAPGRDQTCRGPDGGLYACGKAAAEFMRGIVQGRNLVCRGHGADSRRAGGAVCYADGLDVGRAVVRAGWAVHARGTFDYVSEEEEAKEAGRGLWSGSFERPQEWQRRHADAGAGEER